MGKRWIPLEANPDVMNQVTTPRPAPPHPALGFRFLPSFRSGRALTDSCRRRRRVQFMWGLGVTEGEVQFCDVYGLDDDLLAMVPQPVLAVIFLYPLTSQVIEFPLIPF
jgi:ubiquitin carboxyl-terminal hydrolase L3